MKSAKRVWKCGIKLLLRLKLNLTEGAFRRGTPRTAADSCFGTTGAAAPQLLKNQDPS